MTHDEPVGIPGNQCLEGHGPCSEALDEESANGGSVIVDRRRTQAALIDQKVPVGAFDPRDRVVAGRVFGSMGDSASTAQMGQQFPTQNRSAVGFSARAQEPLDTRLVQGLDPKPLALKPAAEVPHKPKLASPVWRAYPCVASQAANPSNSTASGQPAIPADFLDPERKNRSTSVFSMWLATLPAGEDARIIPETQTLPVIDAAEIPTLLPEDGCQFGIIRRPE